MPKVLPKCSPYSTKRSKITNVLSKTQGVEKEEVVDASFNSKNTFLPKSTHFTTQKGASRFNVAFEVWNMFLQYIY